MKAADLTYLKRWVGKLAIYSVSKNNIKPKVVYITGFSKIGTLKGKVLNRDTIFIGNPKYCIEYSPRVFDRILFSYHRRHAIECLNAANRRAKAGKY